MCLFALLNINVGTATDGGIVSDEGIALKLLFIPQRRSELFLYDCDYWEYPHRPVCHSVATF